MIELKPHTSPADVAYLLMKNEARAMNSLELVNAVTQIMRLDLDDPEAKSKVYTSINLDPRLVFLGKGAWGIRDWSPSALAAATSVPDLLPGEKSYQPKLGDYMWEEDEDDPEDEVETVPGPEEDSEEPER